MQFCGSCRHFLPYVNNLTEWDEDEPGSCEWRPPPLPLSWEFAPRERVGVSANTPADSCPCWAERLPSED
jgi:hypothetical protein